tara:strand:- start:3807 stop:4154 length:348 start_codon:yes stop_codon:yes gene_type:complete
MTGPVEAAREARAAKEAREARAAKAAGVYATKHEEEWNGWKPPAKSDPVNSPNHYTQGGIECFDSIQASMSKEAFDGFLKGNAMKYIWRYDKKGKAKQDLDKANWYLTRLRSMTA